MQIPPIDRKFLLDFLTGLLNAPSPTGFTEKAVAYTENTLSAFPQLSLSRTRKGALLASLSGQQADEPRALTAHLDTLGGMVKEIKTSGRLRLTSLGGLVWGSVESEGVTIFSASGKLFRGSFVLHKSAVHVYGEETYKSERNDDTMEVRLDERTSSAEETRALGIEVGDFVAFDPRVEINNNFIRSRHLDDKACAACLVAAIEAVVSAGLPPLKKSSFYFSNYEEVGHGGASGIPEDTAELLVVDMAAVGDGQNSDEYHATLCLKDSGGPYHHALSQRLRRLAEDNQIAYRVDTYPHYASDGTASWRAGSSASVALIGPGVDASHSYERTHLDALVATTQWILAYLLN
jgi:putative aminopeptidase FrvX